MLTPCILPSLIIYSKTGNLPALKDIFNKTSRLSRHNIISRKTALGCTCLLIATKNGQLEIVKYLIDFCNADVNQTGCVNLDNEIIEDVTPLWCAANAGSASIVEVLLIHGADINRSTITNSSPLRVACYDNRYEAAECLLKYGADIEIPNRFGHTCLMVSCFRGNTGIVQLLLDHGARVNRKGNRGNTALHDCAETGNVELYRLLLCFGAKIRRDDYGVSPVITAANAGQLKFVQELSKELEPRELAEAFEVLGSHFIDREQSIEIGLSFWSQAAEIRDTDLKLPAKRRPVKHFPTYLHHLSSEVFHNIQEFSTTSELAVISEFPDLIRINSLLVRLRLMGPVHPDTIFYIRRHGAKFADANEPRHCLAIWHFLLELHRVYQDPLDVSNCTNTLVGYAELVHQIMINAYTDTISSNQLQIGLLLDCLAVTVDAITKSAQHFFNTTTASVKKLPWFYTRADTGAITLRQLMALALYFIHIIDCNYLHRIDKMKTARARFARIVYRLVRLEPTCHKGFGLLHMACVRDTGGLIGRKLAIYFPSVPVVRVLLRLGANPNTPSVDLVRPINMVFPMRSAQWHKIPAKLLKLLVAAGAHLDVRPRKLHSINVSSLADPESQECLQGSGISPLNHTTLKCLCAKVIVQARLTQLCDIVQLPRELVDFVAMH